MNTFLPGGKTTGWSLKTSVRPPAVRERISRPGTSPGSCAVAWAVFVITTRRSNGSPRRTSRRQRHPLDDDFGAGAVADRGTTSMPTPAAGQRLGLLHRVAEVLVAVADQHDPLGGVLGEEGLGEFHRRRQVGVLGIDDAFDRLGRSARCRRRAEFRWRRRGRRPPPRRGPCPCGARGCRR